MRLCHIYVQMFKSHNKVVCASVLARSCLHRSVSAMADTAGEGSRGQSCLSSSFNAPSTLWGMCCSLPRHHKAFLWIVRVEDAMASGCLFSLCCFVHQVFIQALIVIGHRTYQFATVTVTVDTTWFFMLLVVSAIFVVYFAVHSTLFANVRACAWLCFACEWGDVGLVI